MFKNSALANLSRKSLDERVRVRNFRGGFGIEKNYTFILNLKDKALKTYGTPLNRYQKIDMLLAKAICDTSNSNTITLVRNCSLIGNGVGQQSRVIGAKVAIMLAKKSKHTINSAIAASDSFFPFADGAGFLARAGVAAIIATSGSLNDKKVIKYLAKRKVTLCHIPDEKARGFYNH